MGHRRVFAGLYRQRPIPAMKHRINGAEPLPARSEAKMLELTEISLYLEQLPEELEGLQVLHVSDLHSRGYHGRERRLHEVMRQGCDLFVCTGDSCGQSAVSRLRRSESSRCSDEGRLSGAGPGGGDKGAETIGMLDKVFSDLDCSVSPLFVQGNHDCDEFLYQLSSLGATVLVNETRQIDIPGRVRINICAPGKGKRRQGDVAQTLLGVDRDLFTLALCHYPELGEPLAAAGVELILSGHTHGGQICLPGGRPIVTHSRTGVKYAAGLARIGNSWLYTSRGMGTSILPIRIFCRAEITRLTLHRGPWANTSVSSKKL